MAKIKKEKEIEMQSLPSIEELRKMAAVDIKNVDRSTLVDINTVKIDPKLSRDERMRSFLRQIKNPYCYLDGDMVIKVSFMDTDVTLDDRLKEYIRNL